MKSKGIILVLLCLTACNSGSMETPEKAEASDTQVSLIADSISKKLENIPVPPEPVDKYESVRVKLVVHKNGVLTYMIGDKEYKRI
jgi:hypothetical protein